MTGRQPVKLDWKCLHFFAAHGDGTVTLDRPNVPLS
jgi:ligand-binding SRPBCC domain-containing protein